MRDKRPLPVIGRHPARLRAAERRRGASRAPQRAHGLATCAQQAFARYHRIVSEHLQIPASELLVCGMSMGYADADATVNGLATEREPVARFATFDGF